MQDSEPHDRAGRPRHRLTTDERDDAVVIGVAGDVDYDSDPELHAAVCDALGRLAGRRLVLDLTEVEFFGSAGVAELAESLREAKRNTSRFDPLRVVVDRTRPVIRPLELTGLDQLLTLCYSVDDALAE